MRATRFGPRVDRCPGFGSIFRQHERFVTWAAPREDFGPLVGRSLCSGVEDPRYFELRLELPRKIDTVLPVAVLSVLRHLEVTPVGSFW